MEPHEYIFVKNRILKLTGVNLDCYKNEQMQRRLQAALVKSGYTSWPAYLRAIQHDPDEIGRLRDALTINVTTFFRDPDKYQYLQDTVLPELRRGRPSLCVWSAGCSRGHEPYSLAILLAEATSPYSPHRIIATDIDQSALDWAQAGGPYTEEELAHTPTPWLHRYFVAQDRGYWVSRQLRKRITFCQHNLLAEPFFPAGIEEGGCDLIVCRNVVIYFMPEVKEQLYRRFQRALRPGGVLFIGGTEMITKAAEMGFEMMAMSFYRRSSESQDQPEENLLSRIETLRQRMQQRL